MSIEHGLALRGMRKVEIEALVQIAAATVLVKRRNLFVRPAEFYRHPGFGIDERTIAGLERKGLVKIKWCYNWRELFVPPHLKCVTLRKLGRWTAAHALAQEADRIEREQREQEVHSLEDAISGSIVPVAGRDGELVDPLSPRQTHDRESSSQLIPARSLSGAKN